MLNIFSKKDRMILRSDMWNLGFVTDDVADVKTISTFNG